MKRIIRIMMLLAAMMVTAGQAWALRGGIAIMTGTVEGGTLTFYKTYEGGTLSDEIGENNIVAEPDKAVYIKATAESGYTVTGMTATNFTVVKSDDTGSAEAPIRRSNNLGVNITVTKVADGIFSFTMPDDGANVIVSAEFLKLTAISVEKASLELEVLDEIVTGATLTPSGAGDLTYTISNSSVVKVEDGKIKALAKGNATITVSFAGNAKYAAAESKTISVTVSLKEATVTINGGEDKTVTYGDADFTLTKTVTDAGSGTGVWTWTSSDTDVATIEESTGTITIKKTGSTTIKVHYESGSTMGETSIKLTVNAKTLGITWNADGLVYDGTPKAPTATLSGVKSGDDCTVGISVEGNHTAAGTDYTATATLSGAAAGNYALPNDNKSQTFSIAQKPVTVTGITASEKVYDGKTNVTLNADNASVSGKVGEENVTVNISTASGTVTDKNVGTGKAVTVTGVALGGTDAGNYTLSAQPTGVTVSITPATIAVAGITASSKTYDGTTSANISLISAMISGKVQGDDLNFSAIGTFSDKNVGEQKTVNISITLSGDDKANYTLASTGSQTSTKADITPKDLEVTADDFNVKYGDPVPTYTASYSGFVNDETSSVLGGTLSFTCAYTSSSNTGTYNITPGGLTSSNYSITFIDGTLTVEAKDINYTSGTITLDEDGYTVILDEGTGSANTLPNDEDLANLTYSRTLTAPGNGEGDITIDDKAAKLYTVCLPFAPKTGTAVKYYTLGSVDGSVLNFDEVITPAANTPYLVAVFGNNNFMENCTNENVTTTDINSKTVDGYKFTGTFTGLSHANAVGKYILQPGSKWSQVQSNGTVKISPFRAYIEPATNAPSLMDGTFGGDITGIDSIRLTDADDTEHWYDLNGRRISKPQKGVYILNGKKVVIK